MRERELIELIANAFDLPTRTELDDAHRSVHDLKREVRALRREVDELRATSAGTQAATHRAADSSREPARAQGTGYGTPHPA
jgi:hypothetical protein